MNSTRPSGPRSLKAHLSALVLLIVIPLISLQAWTSATSFRRAREFGERSVLARAQVVSASLSQFLGQSESLMAAIAREYGEALVEGSCGNFLPIVERLLDFVQRVGVADANGRFVCTSQELVTESASGWSWWQAVHQQPFVVGDPVVGTLTQTWIVSFAVPIRDADEVFLGTVSGSVPLLDLQHVFEGAELLEDEIVTIANQNRIVVARSGAVEKWVGTQLPTVSGDEREVAEGQFLARGPDPEGIDRLWGQVTIEGLGWTVNVGTPIEQVYGQARREATRQGLLTLFVIGLASVFASLLYRRISLSMVSLLGATQEIMEGLPAQLPRWVPAEVREVVDRFGATMADRRRAEEKEKEAGARYESLFENAVFGMTVSDQSGTFLAINPAMVQMLGYDSADELIAIGSVDLWCDPQRRMEILELVAKGGQQSFEHREADFFRKDGSVITLDLAGRVILGEDGITRFETMIQDVTERRRLQAQLDQSGKMEAIGQLAGGLAHDFNNLLTVIGGRTEMVRSKLESSDLRSDLEEVGHAADHAASLTRQLLAFSRQQVLELRVIDLGSVVSGLVAMVRRLIPEDIELKTKLAPHLARVKADRTQIEQVILNLAVNARDAMPQGGQLTIEVRNVELTEDFTRENVGAEVGPHVMLAVHDTGVGMDTATQSRIFEPFFTTKEGSQGTGLGLATVYGIVKQSGGYVRVLSQVGQGTTFEAYFPKTDAEPEDTLDKGAVGAGSKTSGNVLLVEDSIEVRELTRDFLISAGHDVIEAVDCADAIRIFEGLAEPVDLLITDVVMPDMSGPELAEHLISLRPSLRILFLSGYIDESLHERIAVLPTIPLLTKPFTFEELCAKVAEVLAS